MLTRRSRPLVALLVALLVVATGCASTHKTLVVSGEGLALTGNLFADTGKVWNTLLDGGTITPEQYKPWRTFALKFRGTPAKDGAPAVPGAYELLVNLWKAAKKAQTEATSPEVTGELVTRQQQIERALASMMGELQTFFAQGTTLLSGKPASTSWWNIFGAASPALAPKEA